MNTPDITKHPLYRPHHGDMKGYRFVELTEVMKPGDEYFGPYTGCWTDADIEEGCKDKPDNSMAFRRRISPESKPADEKRFVTLVCEISSVDDYYPPKIGHTIDGTHYLVSIREGNALAALDGIEDRAIEAVRQAVKGGAK